MFSEFSESKISTVGYFPVARFRITSSKCDIEHIGAPSILLYSNSYVVLAMLRLSTSTWVAGHNRAMTDKTEEELNMARVRVMYWKEIPVQVQARLRMQTGRFHGNWKTGFRKQSTLLR
jgi:hypothetical protein